MSYMQGRNPEKSWTITATDDTALIMINFSKTVSHNVLFYRDPEEEPVEEESDEDMGISKCLIDNLHGFRISPSAA